MESLQSSLFEAAAKGCVDSLQQLLINDPLILERDLADSFNETPLHVAARSGHVEFVKKVIEINPQLVHELNLQKRSPLHLAADAGYVDVVAALLSVSRLTCIARDRKGLTPVHLAAMKGRDEAVKLLLEAQPFAATMLVYDDQQTILHLCVKYHQLETLKLIVMTLNDPEFRDSKDAHGNTALDLAVADKQVETAEFLVSMVATAVEVKVQNQDGDILIRDSEATKPPGGGNNSSESEIRWASEGLMVVAVLLAGMIFQIAINPPGGVWQEDNFLMNSQGKYVNSTGSPVEKPVDAENNPVPYPLQAGHSVLARNNPSVYKILCICNGVGFSTCLIVLLILITGVSSNKVLKGVFYVISLVAFSAVTLSYSYAVLALTPSDLAVSIGPLTFAIPLISLAIFYVVNLYRKSIKEFMEELLLLMRHAAKSVRKWLRA